MNPFIIWTVQRTGGTNFATNLVKLSGLPIIEHEPLNVGRSFGYISRNWRDTHDKSELDKSIGRLLEKKSPIKHCVETVDWEINNSLIAKSIHENYFNIILYRENTLDRLTSLHFALETGLWGRKKVSMTKDALGNEFISGLSIKKIDAKSMIDHEKNCNVIIINVIRELQKSGKRTYAISFEDLYEKSHHVAEEKISILLREIGITEKKTVEDFVKKIREVGDQGSKALYTNIEGYDILKEELLKLTSLRKLMFQEFPEIVL